MDTPILSAALQVVSLEVCGHLRRAAAIGAATLHREGSREAAIAIGYRAAAFAEDACMLNRAFCSSLSVA